jgi:hypothetical protein
MNEVVANISSCWRVAKHWNIGYKIGLWSLKYGRLSVIFYIILKDCHILFIMKNLFFTNIDIKYPSQQKLIILTWVQKAFSADNDQWKTSSKTILSIPSDCDARENKELCCLNNLLYFPLWYIYPPIPCPPWPQASRQSLRKHKGRELNFHPSLR